METATSKYAKECTAYHSNMCGEYHTRQAILDEFRARTDRTTATEIQVNLASIRESADLVVHNKIKAKLARQQTLIQLSK